MFSYAITIALDFQSVLDVVVAVVAFLLVDRAQVNRYSAEDRKLQRLEVSPKYFHCARSLYEWAGIELLRKTEAL